MSNFDLTPYINDYIEKEPYSVGELRETRHFEHPTKKSYGVYSGPHPEAHFVHVNLTCPLCGAPTQSYPDCPGYGKEPKVMVCGGFYSDETITEKHVFASACGNSNLYVCINPDCEWEWRTHNNRSDNGIDPPWKDHAENYNPFGDIDDDL